MVRRGASPPSEQAAQLWAEFAESRSDSARAGLIELYLPFSTRMARILFARRGGLEVEFDDYLQQARTGMIEAIDRYDPRRGISFEVYAATRIRGSVLNSLASMSEKYAQLDLRKRLRAERLDSLTEAFEVRGPARVDTFLELADLAIGLAVSYMLEDTGLVNRTQSPLAMHRDAYASVAQRQVTQHVRKLVDALPERERLVIRAHYFQGESFSDIAERLKLTRGRVSQIHSQALQLIREAYGGDAQLDLLG